MSETALIVCWFVIVTWQASEASKQRHEAILAEFEKKRRARTTTVPTDDAEVRGPTFGLHHSDTYLLYPMGSS